MNPDIGPVVLANSKFSIDLLKKLCKATTGDVIFSPLSISSALGLVLLGARNNTAAEMYQTLRFDKMRIMYHYLYEELYKEGEYKYLKPDNKKIRSLRLVNRLFGDTTFDFNDVFLNMCEEWCFSSWRSANFQDPDAASKINASVKNKIGNVLGETGFGDVLGKDAVSKDTSLLLISVALFKRNWAKSFTKKDGTDRMIKLDTLPLGTIPHRQHGTTDTKARILEIPYEYNHLSMFIILPDNSDELTELVDSITYEQIMEWTQPDNMIEADVNVEMPIFKLKNNYERKDLQKALEDLGIKDLFSDKCDLTGMAPGNLKLSETVHMCFVEVNETGTDAGALSGVVVKAGIEDAENFIVDRPFLFFIRHNSTNTILFWSRVVSPSVN